MAYFIVLPTLKVVHNVQVHSDVGNDFLLLKKDLDKFERSLLVPDLPTSDSKRNEEHIQNYHGTTSDQE